MFPLSRDHPRLSLCLAPKTWFPTAASRHRPASGPEPRKRRPAILYSRFGPRRRCRRQKQLSSSHFRTRLVRFRSLQCNRSTLRTHSFASHHYQPGDIAAGDSWPATAAAGQPPVLPRPPAKAGPGSPQLEHQASHHRDTARTLGACNVWPPAKSFVGQHRC